MEEEEPQPDPILAAAGEGDLERQAAHGQRRRSGAPPPAGHHGYLVRVRPLNAHHPRRRSSPGRTPQVVPSPQRLPSAPPSSIGTCSCSASSSLPWPLAGEGLRSSRAARGGAARGGRRRCWEVEEEEERNEGEEKEAWGMRGLTARFTLLTCPLVGPKRQAGTAWMGSGSVCKLVGPTRAWPHPSARRVYV